MRRDLATLWGIGLVKFAPGTWASFIALGFAAVILALPYGWALLALAAGVMFYLGIGASDMHMRIHNMEHDPSEIVVDELVGQWITFTTWQVWMVLLTGISNALVVLNEVHASPLYLALGFVLFRFFDIIKPWPISHADKRVKGGFGVMFDDLLAGIAAGTALYVIHLVLPFLTGDMAMDSV